MFAIFLVASFFKADSCGRIKENSFLSTLLVACDKTVYSGQTNDCRYESAKLDAIFFADGAGNRYARYLSATQIRRRGG